MKVKICPVCGVMLDASQWMMDTCPACEAKQPNAPWRIVHIKTFAEEIPQKKEAAAP